MRKRNEAARERMIQATIREIEIHGITDLSIRRVAADCGVSCAAPYKLFKNKHVLILEVLRYINRKWAQTQQELVDRCTGDYRTILVEISIAYIRFLCDNPGFYSVIFLNERSMDEEQIAEKGRTSVLTGELIHRYCKSVQMRPEDVVRKTYIVRSLIYGAAILIHNESLADNSNTFDIIRASIEREFTLA